MQERRPPLLSYYGRTTIQIEKCLANEAVKTVADMSIQTGINRDTVSKSINRMVKRGDAHIADWKREQPGTKAHLRPAYMLGQGINKRKPEPLTGAQKSKRYRRKGTVKTVWVLN